MNKYLDLLAIWVVVSSRGVDDPTDDLRVIFNPIQIISRDFRGKSSSDFSAREAS